MSKGNTTGKVVICGSNAYEKKYYFNPEFNGMPQSIKDELHIICVLFTEDVGGIFTILFDEEGNIAMETEFAPDDFLYDEINSGLMIGEVRRNRQELFESLNLYYRVVVLHETLEDIE